MHADNAVAHEKCQSLLVAPGLLLFARTRVHSALAVECVVDRDLWRDEWAATGRARSRVLARGCSLPVEVDGEQARARGGASNAATGEAEHLQYSACGW